MNFLRHSVRQIPPLVACENGYEAREPKAIEEYCILVLSRSTYPDWMPQEFEISYIPEGSTLLVSYSLPSVEGGVENISSTLDKDYHYDFFEREIRDSL